MKVTISPDLDDELEAAFNYFEQQSVGLGRQFADEFRRGIEMIQRFPQAWGLLNKGTRRYQLRRFRYGILYKVDLDENVIAITGLVHLESDPRSWRLD